MFGNKRKQKSLTVDSCTLKVCVHTCKCDFYRHCQFATNKREEKKIDGGSFIKIISIQGSHFHAASLIMNFEQHVRSTPTPTIFWASPVHKMKAFKNLSSLMCVSFHLACY